MPILRFRFRYFAVLSALGSLFALAFLAANLEFAERINQALQVGPYLAVVLIVVAVMTLVTVIGFPMVAMGNALIRRFDRWAIGETSGQSSDQAPR